MVEGVRSVQVRDELQALVSRDLLGPWAGETETLDTSPRNRYLVGMLAPIVIDPERAHLGVRPPPDDAEDSDDELLPLDDETDVRAAEPADNDDDKGPSGDLVHPTCMGLRFQVPVGTPRLDVLARWGRFTSRREKDDQGRTTTYWDREQISERCPVELSALLADPEPIPLHDGDASLRVEVMPDPAEDPDRWIVELSLVNELTAVQSAPPQLWMFQTELVVTAPEGEAVFLPTQDCLQGLPRYQDDEPELQHLSLLYRDRLEYAIGRTCATTAEEVPGRRRARLVRTTWLPTVDVPQTQASGAAVLADMQALAHSSPGELRAGVEPLLTGYWQWLGIQAERAAELPTHLQPVAKAAIARARWALTRLTKGLELLTSDEDALRAFRFMNRVMREQRIHSQIVARRAEDPTLSVHDAEQAVLGQAVLDRVVPDRVVPDRAVPDPDEPASWRPFQLAFILTQLPALTDPTHEWRSGKAARAELLFFPTGGGKTEAYLGLAAYTFAIRRLQGVVDSVDGPLDGGDGVAVLMRYTLRLLTAQQFQRATTLVCAAELERRKDEATWGGKQFRIGLWVGSQVTPKTFTEARREVDLAHQDSWLGRDLTVLAVKRCPWCGTEIKPAEHVIAEPVAQRVFIYCGDPRGSCPFSRGGAVDGGLPMLTVDEEIYRYPPTFLLATVDKFARLAREGEAASIFGYVREHCARHGYRHVDGKACGRTDGVPVRSHPTKNDGGRIYPKVTITPATRLRPPDLIIQDELHLISGALGTTVGLFEAAVDTLCSWQSPQGVVKPLVVASTATVRNAANQVQELYGRGVAIFPPQVLDVGDSYFATEIEVSPDHPGRRYLGVCAHGYRLTLAEIRLAEILLIAGQKLLDEHGDPADPYCTVVAYFNATRELAGMRRFLDDDVTTRVSRADRRRDLPKRTGSSLNIGELTSRIDSRRIATTLDELSVPFLAEWHSSPGKQRLGEKLRAAEEESKRAGRRRRLAYAASRPLDVVLATSMLQVGVDVGRLGLMLVVGQPKNTAEYIQASSRVGRQPTRPGLVLSLANWARPRDLAHFEQFEHYHGTFYSQVEALSVTPYSESATDRGLTGVLVSAARVRDAVTEDPSLSPNGNASDIVERKQAVDELVGRIVDRADSISSQYRERVRQKLTRRADAWRDLALKESLSYGPQRSGTQSFRPLLVSPEVTVHAPDQELFRVANSMRDVQPEINLLVHPRELAIRIPDDAPTWRLDGNGGEVG